MDRFSFIQIKLKGPPV